MKGNQTLEKKRVSNKPGLSPVAKTLRSWAREQPVGFASLGVHLAGCWVGTLLLHHPQDTQTGFVFWGFGSLDFGVACHFFSGLAPPQGAPLTASCLGPYEGAVCELL